MAVNYFLDEKNLNLHFHFSKDQTCQIGQKKCGLHCQWYETHHGSIFITMEMKIKIYIKFASCLCLFHRLGTFYS